MILFFFGNVAWAVVFLLEGDVAWCVGSFLWALATAIIGGNILDAPPKFTPRSQSRPKAITTV